MIQCDPNALPCARPTISFGSLICHLLYIIFVIIIIWVPVTLLIVPAVRANAGCWEDAITSLMSISWNNFQGIMILPSYNLNVMEMRLTKVEDYLGGLLCRRCDFSLCRAGAHILKDLTSPMRGLLSPKSWFKHLHLTSQEYDINFPIILLEDQVYIRECWEFLGSKDHVAITLPVSVQIRGISVAYVDPALLSKKHIKRAPRNITLLGHVDLACNNLSDIDQTILHTISSFTVKKPKLTPFSVTNRFLPLLNIRYNIALTGSTSYFDITVPHGQQWIDTVIVEVHENLDATTTCLYHVGIHGTELCEEPPQISSDQSRGGGGTSWVNPRKHAGGATLSDATKRDFRDLKGRGDINLASEDKKDHLLVFRDTGGAPQHREEGYMPMVDARPIPWTPREVANTTTTKEAEKDEVGTVGMMMQMWLCGPGDPFWVPTTNRYQQTAAQSL